MKDYKEVAQAVLAQSEKVLEKRKRERTFLLRWGALAACLVLVAGLSFGLFGEKSAGEIALPPTRIGKVSDGKASYPTLYTPKSGYEEAEIVAWVRIGNWLGEDDLHTSYEAEVIACYKGSPSKTITLFQLGTSRWTWKGYPLHTYGNELLVFLLPPTEGYGEDTYYILGIDMLDFYIVQDDEGVPYVWDNGWLDNMAQRDGFFLRNYAAEKDELFSKVVAQDPYLEITPPQYRRAHLLEDVVALFE